MLPRRKRLARAAISFAAVTVVSVVIALVVRAAAHAKDVTFPGEGQNPIFYWEVARNAGLRGESFPLWNQHACAGFPFLGNPDTQLVSSFLVWLFRIHGDVMARWYPTVGAMLAVAGTFLWCRRALLLAWLPSIFAGALFAASGFLGLHGAVRMVFVPCVLIPWALFLAREGERDLRAASACGLTLALMLLEGGLFPFCFALVALACAEAPRLFTEGGLVRVGRLLGVAALTCFLFGAIKILPVMAQLARAPRVLADLDQGPFTDLISMLGDTDRGGMPGRRYHINEFRGYIGPLAFGMAIAGAGVALILKPRRVDLALILVVAAVMTRGHFAEYAPWTLLTRLPVFNQLQVPSRFVVVVDLAAAAAAAVALDAAFRAVKRPLLWVPLVVAAVVAVIDPLNASRKLLTANLNGPWLPRDSKAGRFHLVAEDLGRIATLPARNVGVPACPAPWPYNGGNGFVTGEVPQASVDAGKVASVDVKQNLFAVDVTANQPTALRLNQTFDPDFAASVGQVRRSARGTLDVTIPAGTHHVDVRYRPKGLWPGVLALFAGVLAMIGAFFLQRRIRR